MGCIFLIKLRSQDKNVYNINFSYTTIMDSNPAEPNEDYPETELTRDEKGMLFYKLEDFEKLFAYFNNMI